MKDTNQINKNDTSVHSVEIDDINRQQRFSLTLKYVQP